MRAISVMGMGRFVAGIGSGIALGALLLGAAPAFAGVGGGVVPHYENPVNVGESYPAFITITNTSDGDNETEFVKVTNIVHTPSCVATSGLGVCGTTDPGVFTISNPVGTLSCAANTFNVSAPAGGTGEVTFTSPTDVILGRADGIGGIDSRCRISFTVTVLKKATPGPNTLPLGRAQLQGVTSLLIGQASGATTTTVTAPTIQVAKTPDGQTINAGDTATFTIVVSNTGTGTAKTVTLSDALPAGDGIVWTTATAGCTTSGLNLSCNLGDIAASGSSTVVVSGKTSFQACTWMPNPAAIASAANAASKQDDGVITCLRPALQVVKTPDGQTINAGDTATFTIVVSNTGQGIARSVTLADALPVGDGISWATATAGCTTNGLNLSCTFGDLAPNDSRTVVVSGKTSYQACTWMPNPAAIASATNAPNAQNDGVITCLRPALQVAKTPDGQTINAGDTATFTIVVTNSGPGLAKSVTLSDALPSGNGLTWTTATAGCTTSGLNLSCAFGDMPATDSRTVVVSAKTSVQSCTWMPNPAAVASATNAANAQDDGVITCVPPALKVVKTPDGQTINAGDTATFTIVVSNTGAGIAKGVTLNDALPSGDGLTWTTATTGCTTSGLNLSCTLGDLAAAGAPGDSTTVVVSAKTSFTACTWMPNPAAIASATNGTNAQDDGVITCVRPSLHVVKTPDGQTINSGDTATFTIVVSNSGPGIARSVTLSDTLPSGGGLTWSTATTGCTTSGLNLSCIFGDLPVNDSRTVVVSAKTSIQACTTMPNPAAIASTTNGPSAQDDGAITCVPLCQPGDITLDKTCSVAAQPLTCANFQEIECISMEWQGPQEVRITGTAGVTPFDISHIVAGETVEVCGYNGSKNDVVWQIYDQTTNVNIGTSSFNLNCQDADMLDFNDCDKLEGNNKSGTTCKNAANQTVTCNNNWLWGGMSGNGHKLDCNNLTNAADNCSVPAGGADVTYSYTVTNKIPQSVSIHVTDDKPSLHTVNSPDPYILPGNSSHTFVAAPVNITATVINTATVVGNGGQCNAVDEAVTTAPCFLGDPSTNPKLPYPYSTGPHANARTNTIFNESGVLRKLEPSVVVSSGTLRMWYGDEHAMLLGAKSVNGTPYPFTTFVATTPAGTPVAGSATNPSVGATEAQGAVDPSGRPLFPVLFCTDITLNANDTSGDWQQFGTGIGPDFVSGTWKAATISAGVITSGADPTVNHYVMGPGADPVPTGLVDEGYGTEVRWNVSGIQCKDASTGIVGPLQAKHIYRMQFMVHDGDQNKGGGDVGQACAIVVLP